jgi:RNA polymerase-binding transcription factor DksA
VNIRRIHLPGARFPLRIEDLAKECPLPVMMSIGSDHRLIVRFRSLEPLTIKEIVIMTAGLNSLETDNSINRGSGVVWNRLHSEREDICEALLKACEPGFASSPESSAASKEEATRTTFWHRELLQSRLRRIDDALDRLMSGSYGNCCKCGRWIEDSKLDFDPAIAYCLECWRRLQNRSTGESTVLNNENHKEAVPSCSLLEHLVEVNPLLEGVALETLAPFDTIYVQTLNSDYRIFLLDPRTGRALIDGGRHFAEPVEVTIAGSSFGGSTFKRGWIGTGLRLEFRANGKLGSTSPVQSFRVEHQSVAEPALEVSHVIQ